MKLKGLVQTTLSDRSGQGHATISLPYCNLRCPYCTTHELVLHPEHLALQSEERMLETLRSIGNGLDTVCVTGGEPTIHRGLPELLKSLREKGVKIELETNGTQPEILEYLVTHALVDAVTMDVKAPLEDGSYERCAGVWLPVEIIEGSLAVLARAEIGVRLRCTVCPSLLTQEDICRMASDLKRLWVRVTGDANAYPDLALQGFVPDDPMEPSLKQVTPLSQKDLALMQKRMDAILTAPAGVHESPGLS